MTHCVYMLLLQNGQIYIGSSTNPQERFKTNLAGEGSIATRRSMPIKIIFTEAHPDLTSAFQRERQLKKWSHAKKQALANGELSKLKTFSKRRRK